MKLNWLMAVVLGVIAAGCGEVAPLAGAEQGEDELQSVITAEAPRVDSGYEGVSAMAVSCTQYGHVDGACGCSTGSSCGFTTSRYSRQGTCTGPTGCTGCTWGPWQHVLTYCAASTSCTFC